MTQARRAGPGEPWFSTRRVLLVGLIGLFLWIAGDVLLLIFAALLLAVGLDGLARVLADHTRIGRGWALALATVVSFGAVVALGMLVAPQILAQLDDIWAMLVGFYEDVQATLAGLGWEPEALIDGSDGQQQLMDAARVVAGRMANLTLATLGAASSLLLLIAIALFAAADPGLYRGGILKLLPPRRRSSVDATLSAIAHALRWWFLGQLVSMALLGVTVGAGLMVIGVDLWLSLAALTAVLTFIPFLGPLIAAVPIVIIGFAEGAQVGLIVLVFYLVVQTVEGNIIVPMIQHRVVNLAPALLISAQVLLGVLFGAAGLILAAPLTIVAMVAVRRLYVEEVLGEPPADEDGG